MGKALSDFSPANPAGVFLSKMAFTRKRDWEEGSFELSENKEVFS